LFGCVVSTSAIECLEKLISEMTYYVSSWTLNRTHSLPHCSTCWPCNYDDLRSLLYSVFQCPSDIVAQCTPWWVSRDGITEHRLTSCTTKVQCSLHHRVGFSGGL